MLCYAALENGRAYISKELVTAVLMLARPGLGKEFFPQ